MFRGISKIRYVSSNSEIFNDSRVIVYHTLTVIGFRLVDGFMLKL